MSRSVRTDAVLLCVLGALMSTVAYLFFRDHGTILGYKDTLSHLLIGRRIVVGQQTGFGQLGGIWLPLPHLLFATLAWSDTLYLSGLAGSVALRAGPGGFGSGVGHGDVLLHDRARRAIPSPDHVTP